METLVSILVAIVGGLAFLLFNKSKENTSLKAEKDLTEQSERSKIVDEQVSSASVEIDALSEEMDKPVGDKFWKKYTKK